MSAPAASDTTETTASLDTLIPLGVLSLSFAVSYVLRSAHFTYLHESGAAILVGGIVGAVFQYLLPTSPLRASLMFDANFFMVVLLPPIIFESGYSLKKRIFFSNLSSILTFAFLGTLITAAAFGLLTYLVVLSGFTAPLSLLECLIFGAIISATDPVTTLSIFKELHVEPDLYSNVFGESVLNDAVAIALFRVVTGFLVRDVTVSNVLLASGEFLLIFFGSLFIGAAVGLLSALLFKWTALQRWPQMELAVMSVLAWGSFLLSEALHLSGIVAILFAGMFMAHYTQPNLSPAIQELVGNFFGTFAFIAETFVFTSLGLTIFFVDARYDWVLVAACCVNCILSRGIEVFPLSAVINYFRPDRRIEMNCQVMLWYAGLRGAIAFSLALSVRSQHAQQMLSSTLMVVLLSVILLGAGTMPMLSALKIRLHVPDTPDALETSSQHVAWFEWLDQRFLRNVFHPAEQVRAKAPPVASDSDRRPMLSISSSSSAAEEETGRL